MAENGTTVTAKDRKDINIDLHPDFTGESVERYMGFPEQGFRLVISAGRPRTPEEMQALYNVDQDGFYGKAVKQLMYDADGDLKAMIAGKTLVLSEDNAEAIAKAYANILATKEVKRERTMSPETKAKQAATRAANKVKVSAADNIEKRTGIDIATMSAMSADELMALARKMKQAEKSA